MKTKILILIITLLCFNSAFASIVTKNQLLSEMSSVELPKTFVKYDPASDTVYGAYWHKFDVNSGFGLKVKKISQSKPNGSSYIFPIDPVMAQTLFDEDYTKALTSITKIYPDFSLYNTSTQLVLLELMFFLKEENFVKNELFNKMFEKNYFCALTRELMATNFAKEKPKFAAKMSARLSDLTTKF